MIYLLFSTSALLFLLVLIFRNYLVYYNHYRHKELKLKEIFAFPLKVSAPQNNKLLWVYYSIKARTIFFFNAANPKMKNGGFMNESKIEIYDLIPPQYYPKTHIIKVNTSLETVLNTLESSHLQYPLILKPDMLFIGNSLI